jgi:D-glycero-D-manno-heptose 1,7-bisphosphate phosphatase
MKELHRDIFGGAIKPTEKQPCIFLDRDGVIIEDAHYIKSPDDVILCHGAFELFQLAEMHNIPIVIVTNQSGISRGIITWSDYENVTRAMIKLLGCPKSLKAIYANSCGPDAQPNSWRKPSPQMILQAAQDLYIDTHQSVMIGDRISDILCGYNAEVKSLIHVLTGHGAKHRTAFHNLQAMSDSSLSRKYFALRDLSEFQISSMMG